MDFRSMKRKDLQVLCKKNKIPANLSNLEMASRLSELFQEKEKPSSRGWIKGQDDSKSGVESNMVVHREAKKVRFSPEHELIEFTRSKQKTRRSKRPSVLGDNSSSVENVNKAGGKKGKVDCSVRVTQLREKLSVNGVLDGNRRGRSKVNRNNDGDDEVDSTGTERVSEEILDGPGRVTRSRGKKLVESLVREMGRGDDKRIAVGTRRSLRNRGVVVEGMFDRDLLEDNVMAKENLVVARHNLSRRSIKKSKLIDSNSEVCKHDTEKHENDSSMCLRNRKKSLAVEGLEVEVEINGAKVDAHRKVEADCQIDEPMKMELRRSSRRNLEISSHDESGKHNHTAVNDKNSSKTSILHSETSGVCEDGENVIRPSRVRTRDTYLSQKVVSTEGKSLNDAMTHNSETAQQLTEPAQYEKMKISRKSPFENSSLEAIGELGEDVVIQQKNQDRARKRTRDHISGESFVKPKNDTRPLTRSKRKSRRNEKTVSAGVLNNFADQIKLSNILNEPNSLKDSSNMDLLRIGESLCGEALSKPDAAEGSNDTNAKKLTPNKRLAFIREHHRKNQGSSAAVDVHMKPIDVNDSIYMADDPASEISNLQTNSPQSEIGISASKLMDAEMIPSLLRVAEHEIVGKTMSNVSNSKHVLQDFSQSETFGNEIMAADLEVIKSAKADEVKLSSAVLNQSQVKDISTEENLETFEPTINESISLPGCHVKVQNHMEVSKNADMGQKMAEVGGLEHCGEGSVDFTDSMSALEMEEPSSGKLKSCNDAHMESDDAGESRDIEDLKLTSDENMKFGVSISFDDERSAKTHSQDSEMFSEYFIKFTGSTSALEMKEPSLGNLRISQEFHNMTEEASILFTSDTLFESDEAGEFRKKDLMLTRDENMDYVASIPFDDERSARTNLQDNEMCSYLFKDSDKDGIFHDPPVEFPASMLAYSIGKEQGSRSPEIHQVGEGHETSVLNHAHLELAEINKGRCLKDHMRVTDEDSLSASTQFDCQRCACIMPQDCVSCSGECLIEEFGGQGTSHDSQDVASIVTPSKYADIKFTARNSSLQEVKLFRLETSKSQGSHAAISGKCPSIEIEAGVSNSIDEKEPNRSGDEINGDQNPFIDQINNGEYEIFNQSFESSNEAKYEPEQLKSSLTEPTAAIPNTSICEEALNSVSETAGHTMAIFETNCKAEVLNQSVDEKANSDASEKERDDIAYAQTLGVPMPMGVATNQVNLDNQEIDLSNLFGSPVDRFTPRGPKEASTHGTDKTNIAMSLTKSTTNWDHENLKEINQDMEEVSECDHILTDRSSTCPITSKEEYDTGSYAGKEGYQLKFLFATPIKFVASCKVDEAVYDAKEEPWIGDAREKTRESNSPTKEHVVVIENEEVNEDVGCKITKTYTSTIRSEAKCDDDEEQRTENTSECMKESNSISEKSENDIEVEGVNEATLDCKEKQWIDSTCERMRRSNCVTKEIEEDINNEQVIEIEGFEVENIFSSAVFCEAKHDDYEEQYTENTGGRIKKSNSATEEHREENTFALGQSLLDEEATDNDSNSSEENVITQSMKSLSTGEGNAEMLLNLNLAENHTHGDADYVKYGGEITQSSGDVPVITDNDINQGNVVQDSHCFMEYPKDISFSTETLADTFDKNLNPEVANMGSFSGETELLILKDSPPCILLKASHEDDKVIENEDMEMTSSKSHFDGYILESNVLSANDGIQKTCDEKALHHHSVHNMVTAAEQASTFWSEDDPDTLQSLAKNLCVEESECGNAEKTNTETSNFNMEGNQEVDVGGVPEQIFMSNFHLEQDKTEVLTVVDSFVYECSNEILEESHLTNTIKECLESGASLHNDLDGPQGVSDERVAYVDDNDDKPSIGQEREEPEESKLFLGSDEGTAVDVNLSGQKKFNIKGVHSSAAKKNARTILIHGTPKKLPLTDMKENASHIKRSQIGDHTTVRPTKRRALQNVRWKY